MACSFSQHCWTSGRVNGEERGGVEALGCVLGRVEALSSELTLLTAGQRRVEVTLRDIRDGMATLTPFVPAISGEQQQGLVEQSTLRTYTPHTTSFRSDKGSSPNAASLRSDKGSSPNMTSFRSDKGKSLTEPSTARSTAADYVMKRTVSFRSQEGRTSTPVPKGDLPVDADSPAVPPRRTSVRSACSMASDMPPPRNSPYLRKAKTHLWAKIGCNSCADLSMVEGWDLKWQNSDCSKLIHENSSFRASLTKFLGADDSQDSWTVGRIVRSTWFDNIMVLFIVLNAVILGAQVQMMASEELEFAPPVLKGLQTGLGFFFLAETLLRMYVLRRSFFTGPDMTWNVFDLTVVCFSLAEVILDSVSSGDMRSGGFSMLRVLRILRIVRVVRIIRVVRFFRELRMMVYSVMGSMMSLVWAMCLLLVILFMVAVYLTQSVTSYRAVADVNDPIALSLEQYFSTLFETMYYLLQSVTGGVNWGEVASPLVKLGWWYGLFMSLFTCFTLLALLNIVTGVFVQGAMEKAQNDKEAKIQDEMQQETAKIQKLEECFAELDSDSSGFIDLEEFETLMGNPRVKAYFRSMGIHISTAYHLFRLLDLDNSQTVNISEFVMGCMRLQGQAKNVDVATLMYENKRMMMKWVTFMDYVEEEFNSLHEALDNLLPAKERKSVRRSTWRDKLGGLGEQGSSLNIYEKGLEMEREVDLGSS